MAEKSYRSAWDAETPPFGIQSLLRLAIWVALAAGALGVAVIAFTAGAGSHRQAVASDTSQSAAPPKNAQAETDARLTELATESSRLAETVQALAAERAQVLMRLAAIERGLDDVTGTIKRDASAQRTAAPGQSQPAAALGLPSLPETRSVPAQTPAAQAGTVETTAVAASPDAARAAASSPALVHLAAAEPVSAAGLGVDVGGAINFDGLRTLWSSTKHGFAGLPDELYPVVAVRENSKTRSPELRLVVGPLASTDAAAQICATLAAAHHYCQPVAFEGQRLSLAEPLSKPAASPPPAHRLTTNP
jgi:hypothetical protein